MRPILFKTHFPRRREREKGRDLLVSTNSSLVQIEWLTPSFARGETNMQHNAYKYLGQRGKKRLIK